MSRIKFEKTNGHTIEIDYNIKNIVGNTFTMEIPGVEIHNHTDSGGNILYKYLKFPPPQSPSDPNDLEIVLNGPLVVDYMILPFNGGQTPPAPPNTSNIITIKLKH